MIRCNANLFRLAFMCTSTEETRYYLKGVFVEPHHTAGVTLTATDGHRLVCIHDETGFADESQIVALPANTLKACKPVKREGRRELRIDGKEARILSFNCSPEWRDNDDAKSPEAGKPEAIGVDVFIDGTFPDYRLIIPSQAAWSESSMPGWFNGQYLSVFADISAGLATGRAGAMRVMSSEANSPALILFGGEEGRKAFGVLMPRRGLEHDNIPEWFTAPAPKAEEVPPLQAAE